MKSGPSEDVWVGNSHLTGGMVTNLEALPTVQDRAELGLPLLQLRHQFLDIDMPVHITFRDTCSKYNLPTDEVNVFRWYFLSV